MIKALRDHGHENKKNIHRGLDKAMASDLIIGCQNYKQR